MNLVVWFCINYAAKQSPSYGKKISSNIYYEFHISHCQSLTQAFGAKFSSGTSNRCKKLLHDSLHLTEGLSVVDHSSKMRLLITVSFFNDIIYFSSCTSTDLMQVVFLQIKFSVWRKKSPTLNCCVPIRFPISFHICCIEYIKNHMLSLFEKFLKQQDFSVLF